MSYGAGGGLVYAAGPDADIQGHAQSMNLTAAQRQIIWGGCVKYNNNDPTGQICGMRIIELRGAQTEIDDHM